MTELEISFRPGGNAAAYVREGFAQQEPGGRWMTGQQSRLVIPPAPWAQGGFRCDALLGPFLQDSLVGAQRLTVRVNGTNVLTTRLTRAGHLSFSIPDGVIRPDAEIEIIFLHEDAVAPGRFAPGGDMRELAFSAWSVTLFGPERPGNAPAPLRETGPPVYQLRSRGNLGNRMIEYMVGRAVQARAPCTLSGVELDEWGLSTAIDSPGWADHAVIDDHVIDLEDVAARLRSPQTRKIVYRGYGQRMENFLPVSTYREIFQPADVSVTEYDAGCLVINVRAGDVLGGHFPDYVLIPPGWYRELIDRTGLRPVFMGQLEPNPYIDALRAACPEAQFVPSQGQMADFETVRRAQNVVVSVSTFSWVAAWLSRAARIFLPVNGMFNPLQFPPVDLLPLTDPRYEFHLFPINRAVPLAHLAAAHAAIDRQWRIVTPAELKALLERVPPHPSHRFC